MGFYKTERDDDLLPLVMDCRKFTTDETKLLKIGGEDAGYYSFFLCELCYLYTGPHHRGRGQ